MTQTAKKIYTPEEYLALEAASDQKHEYYRGQIYFMAGAQPPHNVILANLIRHVGNALAGSPCITYPSDQRVYVVANDFYTYPDVSIAYKPTYQKVRGLDSLTNPIVLIEVLSTTTKDYDRTTKFERYKKLPSLQNYILIEQEYAYVQCYIRHDPFWYLQTADSLDQSVHIPTLNIDISLAALYERVELSDPPTGNDHEVKK